MPSPPDEPGLRPLPRARPPRRPQAARPIGEFLDRSYRVGRSRLGVGLLLHAIVPAPLLLLEPLLPDDPEVAGYWAAFWLGFVPTVVLYGAASAWFTSILLAGYEGGDESAGAALRRLGWDLVPIALTNLLAFFLFMLGFLFFVVPGIVAVLAWSLTDPVMVAERRFFFSGLRRSAQIVRGWWRMVAVALALGAGANVALALALVPLVGDLARVGDGVGWLGESFVNVFLTAAMVVLYVDIRSEEESYDLELLARQVEGHGEVPASS